MDANAKAEVADREVIPAVSVVVPFYNPGDRLRPVVEGLFAALLAMDATFEVIAVSDGSTDNSLASLQGVPGLRTIELASNHGKGFAVRHGMEAASGRYIGFIDGDGDIDPATMATFAARAVVEDPDGVLGSKNHPGSVVSISRSRGIMSWLWQRLVRLLFQIPVSDSQAGIKLFRADVVRSVLPHTVLDGFAFDLEFLVVAHDLGYSDLVEAPMTLSERDTSTVTAASAAKMLVDMVGIFWRLRVRRPSWARTGRSIRQG